MYWERSEDVEVPSVYKAMSRNRYVEIKRYFHLANNEELDANREDKMSKVRAWFNLTNKALNQLELWLPRLWAISMIHISSLIGPCAVFGW